MTPLTRYAYNLIAENGELSTKKSEPLSTEEHRRLENQYWRNQQIINRIIKINFVLKPQANKIFK